MIDSIYLGFETAHITAAGFFSPAAARAWKQENPARNPFVFLNIENLINVRKGHFEYIINDEGKGRQ